MTSPAEDEPSVAHGSTRSGKQRASHSRQRCPSPLSKARSLSPSSPVYILRFARGATSPSEAVLQISPECLGLEIAKEKPEQDKPLYVVGGLLSKFLDEMGSCMGIDRDFIDAHAARRCFRPRRTPDQVTWVHWEYPELVTDGLEETAKPEGSSQITEAALDLMREPLVVSMGHGGLSVVFRRISMWHSDRRVVVFLDRSLLDDQLWKKPMTQLSVTKPLLGLAKDPHTWEAQPQQQRALQSIEESLYTSFEAADAAMEASIESTLLKTVYDHWLEVFEALPEPGSGSYNTGSERLLWHMLQALEQNVQMGLCSGIKDTRWESLLRRLERTAHCMVRGIQTNREAQKQEDPVSQRDVGAGRAKAMAETETVTGASSNQGDLPDWEQINKRSIDRIAYLGGIMLPLTVVSGILGIEGRYGPEGTQFWVFWVSAFVSSGICLFIIYLDQLRSLDIWFEVTANDAVEALFQQYPSGLLHPRESGAESGQAAGNQGGPTNPPRRVYSNRNGDIAVEEGGKLHHLTSSSSSGRGRRTIWFEGQRGAGDKAWKRESLGWGGAVKKTVGYYRFKGGNVRFNRPVPGDDG